MTATANGPGASRVLSMAWVDLRFCWLVVAGTALLYTALATVILLPLIGVFFQFLIARTHNAAGKPVYVWTVNDAQCMIRRLVIGADGLITNRPALGKEVVANYATMNSAQRLFLFVMTRLGMREEISEPEGDLRP